MGHATRVLFACSPWVQIKQMDKRDFEQIVANASKMGLYLISL